MLAVAALLITGAAAAAAMVIVSVELAPVPAELLALTVTAVVPATVGVPVMAPEVVFTDNPGGSAPTLKLVGVLLAVRVNEKAVPTVPGALAPLVIAEVPVAGLIVMMMVAVAFNPAESVTVTEPVEVPAVVGVPVMSPEVALMARPAGRPVAA